MITTEKLTELCDRAYRAACDKGFHDEQKPDAVYKMLIITEIAEAVRLDESGRRVRINPQDSYVYTEYLRKGYTEEGIYTRMALGSMEDKLADVIILMLDYCIMKYESHEDSRARRVPYDDERGGPISRRGYRNPAHMD